MAELVRTLLTSIPDPRPKRQSLSSEPFLFAVDHCFAKSGSGTVLTGTVLQGVVRIGEVRPSCTFFYTGSTIALTFFLSSYLDGRNTPAQTEEKGQIDADVPQTRGGA